MSLIKTTFSNMVLVGYFLASLSYAGSCPQALPADDIGFCKSFQAVAQCHCQSSGLPAKMCSNVSQVYQRMISTFGSIERACKYQKDTSYENCMQDWKCYLYGGNTNTHTLCNGTGKACI